MPTEQELNDALAVVKSEYTTAADASDAVYAYYLANSDLLERDPLSSLNTTDTNTIFTYTERTLDLDAYPDKASVQVLARAALSAWNGGTSVSPHVANEFIFCLIDYWRKWAALDPTARSQIWGL